VSSDSFILLAIAAPFVIVPPYPKDLLRRMPLGLVLVKSDHRTLLIYEVSLAFRATAVPRGSEHAVVPERFATCCDRQLKYFIMVIYGDYGAHAASPFDGAI
jgi:hypothetical protein